MGLEFLARIRRSTILLGIPGALGVATYAGMLAGLGLAAGVAWSLVNLALLERLIVAITGSDRRSFDSLKRSAISAGGIMALFGAGGVLLFLLPPIWLSVGFLVPFAVMFLKAASLLLIQSRAWKWMLARPWRAALVVVSLLVAAWWVIPTWLDMPSANPADTASHAVETHATSDSHAVADPHAADPHASDPHAASGAAAHGESDHGGGHGKSSGPSKFPNLITYLSAFFPDAPWVQFLHHWEIQVFSLLFAGLICLVAFLATRRATMIPGRLQNAVEMLVSALNDFITGILGEKHGRRFVPFLGSLFIYIWVMNLAGLVPGLEAPTSSLNTTFALGITVFLYAQWVGLRSLGPVGYFDHLLGSPRDLMSWILVPLMLPIHILGELAKPISLSSRLFGNIFGEDMLLVAFASLGVTTVAFLNLPIGLPLQLPFMFLALLTGTIQALVFTVLSTIYLLLMLPHDDHHAEHAHEGKAHPAHAH
jgi:F-type H+-transporting ATPase subunit a